MIYNLVLLIHVLAAIFALGPGISLKFFFSNLSKLTELNKALVVRAKVLKIIMISGGLLLLSGLIMGFLNTALFKMGWYHASLTLFLIGTAIGPVFLAKKVKQGRAIIENAKGEEIPQEYFNLSNKINMLINIQHIIYLLVLALMVLKPF